MTNRKLRSPVTKAERRRARETVVRMLPFRTAGVYELVNISHAMWDAMTREQEEELLEDWMETRQQEETYSDYNMMYYWVTSGMVHKHLREWGL